jgi:hypothetical protein
MKKELRKHRVGRREGKETDVIRSASSALKMEKAAGSAVEFDSILDR